jgi:hypothetical protein
MILLTEGGVLVNDLMPLGLQNGTVSALPSGMSLAHQKEKILDKSIPERSHGRLVHGIDVEPVRVREFPHLFAASAVETEPPDPKPGGQSRAEEPKCWEQHVYISPFSTQRPPLV